MGTLTVNSANFYDNVSNVRGNAVFSGQYSELHFDVFPTTTDIGILAVDLHVVGDVDGVCFIRARLGEQVVHETSRNLLRLSGREGVNSGDIDFSLTIESITLPLPGLYWFDFIFNDVVLHSTPLTLAEPKTPKAPKQRKRH